MRRMESPCLCVYLVISVCIALSIGPVSAENDRWLPGYSSPGFAFSSTVVGQWNSNGFIMVPQITNCLDVPGPDGTFEKALLWVWNGSYYEYHATGCTVGSVNAVAQRGSQIYIGGSFSSVGGQALQYLARWNGTQWAAPWTDQLNGWVYALAYDGTQNLYVGGSFSSAGSTSLSNVGRLDGFDWEALEDTGGLVQGTNGLVRQIEVGGGEIFVAGQFSTAGGEANVGNIARWSTGGSWSDLGTGVTWAPGLTSLSVGSGEVWVAGGFNDPNIPAKGIAFYDLGDDTWKSPGDPNSMSGLGVQEVDLTGGNRVFARGDFTNFGDPDTRRVAEWTPIPGTWKAIPNIEDAYDPTLTSVGQAILATQNNLFYFDQRSDPQEADLPVFHGGITRFDGTDWHGLGQGFGDWGPDGNGHFVSAIYEFEEETFVGGSFPNAGDALLEGLARWRGGDWQAAGDPLTNSSGKIVVRDFASYQGDLVMGGCFEKSGTATLNNTGRWNGSKWVALGGGVLPSGCFSTVDDFYSGQGVQTLLPMGSDLYAGGSFSGAGSPGDNLARWNGAAWSEVGGGTNGTVTDLAVSGSNLYAAGIFTRVNNNAMVVKRIARWNGAMWDNLGGGMDGGTPQYEGVYALAILGGSLYAAGDFTTAGGVAANNIARWDGSNWHPLGDGVDGAVFDLEVVGTDLYVTGRFTEADGESARGIAKWDGFAWTALGYGLNRSTILSSSVGTGFELFAHLPGHKAGNPVGDSYGELYVGGLFSFTGDKFSNNFGVYQIGPSTNIFNDGFEGGDSSSWSSSVP